MEGIQGGCWKGEVGERRLCPGWGGGDCGKGRKSRWEGCLNEPEQDRKRPERNLLSRRLGLREIRNGTPSIKVQGYTTKGLTRENLGLETIKM